MKRDSRNQLPAGLEATAQDWAVYLEEKFRQADGDAASIARILGDIARARSGGMAEVARKTGLSRESLYRSLDGKHIPSFDTILKVTRALDIDLSVRFNESLSAEGH